LHKGRKRANTTPGTRKRGGKGEVTNNTVGTVGRVTQKTKKKKKTSAQEVAKQEPQTCAINVHKKGQATGISK